MSDQRFVGVVDVFGVVVAGGVPVGVVPGAGDVGGGDVTVTVTVGCGGSVGCAIPVLGTGITTPTTFKAVKSTYGFTWAVTVVLPLVADTEVTTPIGTLVA
jgi:hypothetical protein